MWFSTQEWFYNITTYQLSLLIVSDHSNKSALEKHCSVALTDNNIVTLYNYSCAISRDVVTNIQRNDEPEISFAATINNAP